MVKSEDIEFYKKSHFIVIIVVLSIIIIFLGWFFYNNEIIESRKEAEKDVRAIGELKTKQIAEWYKERIDEIEIRTISPYLHKAIENLLLDKNNQSDRKKIFTLINVHKRKSHFDEIILSTTNCEPIISTNPNIKEFNSKLNEKIILTVKNKSLQTTDIYFDSLQKMNLIDFSTPVKDESGNVLAVMIFRINAKEFLYPFLQSWLPKVKTFETLLVRKENDSVIFLNELKFRKHTALKLKYPLTRGDIPAVNVVLGKTGIFIGNDYRGIPVITYLSHIPGTKWYLVTKIDKSELYKDSFIKTFAIFFFAALLIIAIILLFSFLYNLNHKKVYKNLFEVEKEFETTLYSIGDAVITTDKAGMIKYMNSVAESLTGWNEKEAKGQPIEEVFIIINEETRDKVENPVEKVLREGLVVGLANHTLLISKDGVEIPIADSGAPIKDDEGNIIGVVLVFRDQSEERAIQKAIVDSEVKYRTLFEGAGDAIFLMKNNLFVDCNNKTLEMFGCERKDIIGRHPSEFSPAFQPDGFNSFKKANEKILSALNGVPQFFEWKHNKLDGTIFDTEVNLIHIKNLSGVDIQSIVRDITERKNSEQALKESEEKYREVVEKANDIIFTTDVGGNFTFANHSTLKFTGWDYEEFIQKNYFDLVHPSYKKKVQINYFRQYLSKKESNYIEFPIINKKGELCWLGQNAILLMRNKEVAGFHLVARDITDRKKYEEALKESEEKYRNLVEVSPDGIIIHQHGKIKFANKTAYKLAGFDKAEDIIGKNTIDFVHPDYRNMALKRITEMLEKNQPAASYEEKFIKKDGSLIDVEVVATPIIFGNERAIQTIMRDISERKKKDKELYETKDILEKIYLGIKDGIIVIDSKTLTITGCNYAAEKIFKYTNKELLDKNISILLQDKEQINFEEIYRRFIDGPEDDVIINSEVLQRKDNLLFPATYTVFPLTDNDNNVIRYVLIVRDISEEMKLEQERKLAIQKIKTYASHLQSVREDERTSIAREIHDEIGQALSVMNMNLSLIERDYLNQDEFINIEAVKQEIKSMKSFILKTVGKMRKLIMNLRPEIVEDMDISEAIEWLINAFRKDNNIDCSYIKQANKIDISKDKTIALFRIVQEALRNIALHANATKVEITIIMQKNYYELAITDNGIGFNINEVNYKKSFGITGMKERAELLDGKIEIFSEKEKGTKLIIKFLR